MSYVISFIKYRPIHYTVHFTHDENGLTIEVMDVADTDEDRLRVADALEHAAQMIREQHTTQERK